MDVIPWFIFASLFIMLRSASGVDHDLSCAVCRALVDEVNHEIGLVDPKKKIQVGSFRVDPKGNQKTYEKSYARSEVHLIEIFEGICEKFRKYADTTNSAGKKSIARIEARQDGKALALKNIKVSPETQKLTKYACELLVEDYEDDMIGVFGKDDVEDIEKAICADLTSQCTAEDLTIPMPATEIDENVIIPGDDDNKEDDKDKAEADNKPEDITLDIPDEGEKIVKPEQTKEDQDKEDLELMDQYLRDNLAQDWDSIPADQVIDKTFDNNESSDKKKQEL